MEEKLNQLRDELIECSREKDKEIDDLKFTLREVDAKLSILLTRQTEITTLLQAWQSAQGFVKVIEFMAKVVKAVAPFAVFFGMIYYIVKTGHLPPKE